MEALHFLPLGNVGVEGTTSLTLEGLIDAQKAVFPNACSWPHCLHFKLHQLTYDAFIFATALPPSLEFPPFPAVD